jgi:HK97 family phage prohead protease
MNRKLFVPFELKEVADGGKFSGYASVFGNVDLGLDVVEPKAFKEIVKNPGGKVAVFYWHGMKSGAELPIGEVDVEQDEKGLRVEGEIYTDDDFAARVHKQMKRKSVGGMSIGYDVLSGGAEYDEKGVRHLRKLRLWEVSVLPFGMNPKARVTSVKGALQPIETIRELEDLLRDAAGLSVRQARAIAEGGFKALQEVRENPGASEQAAIAQLIEGRLFNLE